MESSDRPISREESARAYRKSVQRDVEWLLNTRRTIVPVPPGCVEVTNSVHEFGIIDTAGMAIGTADAQTRLTSDIRDTLRRFEPRLSNVRVELTASSQALAPQVHFAIHATLLMDPNPERVVFDTVLEIASGFFDVTENV